MYNVTASPELLTNSTGFVVSQGDLSAVIASVGEICQKGKESYIAVCRQKVVEKYNKNERYMEYIKLYQNLIKVEL